MTWIIISLMVTFFAFTILGLKAEELAKKDNDNDWIPTMKTIAGISFGAFAMLCVVALFLTQV